jgi:hypothetical protein
MALCIKVPTSLSSPQLALENNYVPNILGDWDRYPVVFFFFNIQPSAINREGEQSWAPIPQTAITPESF